MVFEVGENSLYPGRSKRKQEGGKRPEETAGIAEHSTVRMETHREASKILISENSNPKGRNSKEKREPKDPSDLELKTIVQPFSFFQKPILFLELFYQSSGKL